MSLSVDVTIRVGAFDLTARFEVHHGVTALFGPSGAGKTLTLRCISGLSRPDSGRIVLTDRVLLDTDAGVDVPPRKRRVGYVFQHYALFPHLNVERNVSFGMDGLPREERERRVSELLRLVSLEGMQKRSPSELSGGQQQRVALARALATDPQLLMLDEPFAAVDHRVRRRLRAELLRIHEVTSTPMLLVTHDLAEVRQLSDSLVILDQGRTVRSGPTGELLRSPPDPELAELIE